jgi:putative salt-induced outer membrane protein YdiY
MKYSVRCLLAALTITGISSAAMADELRLKDGSTLNGQVSTWSSQSVTLDTSFAGQLTIDRALITSITADETVLVEVNSGDKIVGRLQHDADKGQLLLGTSFGDLKVDLSQVRSITLAGEGAQTTVAVAPTETPAVNESSAASSGGAGSVAVPAFQPATPVKAGTPTKWTGRIEAGVDGATGNTERLNARGRAEVRRTAERDRTLFYFQGTYAKQNGARSANEIIGGAELEVDVTPRLFAFGKASLEYDEFENLDLRAMVTAGLGYFVIREDEQHLKLRAGAGYKHESYSDGDSQDTGILELGIDYMKQISPWFTYTHSTTYYPTLRALSDFRIVMENAAEIPITKDKDWKIRTGIKNEYDSQPESGVERLDTTYFANLVWDFR